MVASAWGGLEEMIGFQTYCEDAANRFAGGWLAGVRESKETDRREKEGRVRPGLRHGRTCCRLRRKNVDRMGSLGEISSSVGDMLSVKCPLDVC